jgi:hypothetical protein
MINHLVAQDVAAGGLAGVDPDGWDEFGYAGVGVDAYLPGGVVQDAVVASAE